MNWDTGLDIALASLYYYSTHSKSTKMSDVQMTDKAPRSSAYQLEPKGLKDEGDEG